MSSPHHFVHGRQKTPHSHNDRNESGHRRLDFMSILGIMRVDHDSDWINDYRSRTLIPVSKRVLLGTIVILIASVLLSQVLPANIGNVALVVAIVAAAYLIFLLAGGLIVSLYIRHQRTTSRQMVITSIPWQGTEAVLDVGCGTGMLLNGCAQQLTTGKAIGVDLWQESIAGTPDVLLANAKAEGVSSRIAYQNMDARHLTFDEAQFNVAVSSFALHHIGTRREDREQAISEMMRVLAPGGYLSLLDVPPMIDIAETIVEKAGMHITASGKTSFFRHITAHKLNSSQH